AVKGGAGSLFHRHVVVVGRRAEKLRSRTDDVDDRMQANRLHDHAAPTSFERAENVVLRFRRRCRREEKGILELDAGERDGSGWHWLVLGYWLLVTGYWLLVAGYWLLVARCSLRVTSPFAVA